MGELPNYVSPKLLIELNGAAVKPCLVDVRKRPAFASSGQIITGAVWRDHEAVETWEDVLAFEGPVIVYCVHGHEVSQNATAKLVSMGVEARYLQGGFEAWCVAGGPVIEQGRDTNFEGNE